MQSLHARLMYDNKKHLLNDSNTDDNDNINIDKYVVAIISTTMNLHYM